MKRLQFILLFLIVLFAQLNANSQLYHFRKFNHKDGLNMAAIKSIHQSDNGLLWIGSDGAGLITYDGYDFNSIRVKNFNSNFHIQSIHEHGDSILLATQYNGFYIYSISKNSYRKIPHETPYGDGLLYTTIDSSEIIVHSTGINTRKKNILSSNYMELFESFICANKLFLFTSEGNYCFSNSTLTPLNQILPAPDSIQLDSIRFGFNSKEELILFDRNLETIIKYSISKDGKFKFKSISESKNILFEGESIIDANYNLKSTSGAVITSFGRIYKYEEDEFKRLVNNYDGEIHSPHSILTDYNGDYWVSSTRSGFFKISKEPFTRIELDPLYASNNLTFIYQTVFRDVLLTDAEIGTIHKNLNNPDQETKYRFKINSIDSHDSTYYIGTSNGLRVFHPKSHPNFDVFMNGSQSVTMVKVVDNSLYFGVVGKGLFKYEFDTKNLKQIKSKNFHLPDYFYRAEHSGEDIYFGTNNGIYKYNIEDESLSKVKLEYIRTGTYSGLSTKDKFGNCWFSLNNGLVVIRNNGEIKYYDAAEYFPSNLFYSLIADGYGRIIVGTNNGLSIFKTDVYAKIKSLKNFDADNGFNGYETNMRSQFRNGDNIFLGTIEGLFVVHTKVFDQLDSPIAPTIILDDPNNLEEDQNSRHFTLKTYNSKAGEILYSFYLSEYDDNWSIPSNSAEISYFNLPNGKYTLLAKGSFDGVHFSDAGSFTFEVNRPLWQTNWFLVIIITFIVILNIVLLSSNKVFDTASLLDTKDTTVHLKMTPSILLFSTVLVTSAHVFGPMFSDELEMHVATTIGIGLVLTSLYLMSLSSRSNGQEKYFTYYLMIALISVVGHFFYELYMSNLHPYHIIGIMLSSIIAPYIISKMKPTLIFSIIVFAFGIVCTIIIKHPVYPKIYFLIALFSMCCLLIFASYLRFDSLEKLLFVSGLINKGSIVAIAYNDKGKLTYVSENINNFINESCDELVGKHITHLNQFIPYDYRETDAMNDLKDGDKYLVPMSNSKGEINWLEWSYKQFSKTTRVLLGQDVTTRMDLENTYELLVQNAQDFIYRVDLHGNFVFLNDAMIESIGYEKEEIVGSSSMDIVHETFRSDIEQYYKYHFQKRLTSSYKEFPIRRKDGSIIWIGQYVTTLFAPGSKTYINGFLALARDITDFKRQQKLIIEQKDNITDSINYAKRIQFNLLPHRRKFASLFKDHFIIYKPKDIVSGDFYWVEKIGSQTIIALADCTGHGVPGAFMTLLGINLLNSIVSEDQILDPGQILIELDKRLLETLPKGEGEGEHKLNDAIEITICIINDENYDLSYACAGSRFLIYGENGFTMYKGSNKHIGDPDRDDHGTYQTSYTKLLPTDQLFLLTDGFQDQFGGPNDKKFSFRRVLEIFEAAKDETLTVQCREIEDVYDDWIADTEQTDDLTVISIVRNI